MRKPSKKVTISPSPRVFGGKTQEPENLKRQISTEAQRDGFEDIIIYGSDNALPLRIALAVEESPAASSCIGTISKFIKGSGFSNKDLMNLVIDADGTTLWDFHTSLADSLALFWGFSVNFKFNRNGRITNAYQMSFECCRFEAPGEKTPVIRNIKYNPYFGTDEYRTDFTKTYPVFNIRDVKNQISGLQKKEEIDAWPGQVYYYGKTSPLSRFYPKPKYWSAKEAIQADHKLQEFHNEELENGFFQSVLINAIGNPNEWSKNPAYQKEELKADGTTKIKTPTKTIGEEFNIQMAETFSGSKKAGTAMVLWSLNQDSAIKVTPFPVGINGDRIVATQNSITKTITIATEVPSILANISEGVSLGSDGNEMQKAIELMQSRTVEWRQTLENFYNNILLPNLENVPKGISPEDLKVEIQNYNPITVPKEPDDKIWEFLNPKEREAFIKKNYPEIEIIREVVPVVDPAAPVVDPENPDAPPAPAPAAPNEALKNLNIADINKIQKIVSRYNLSLTDPNNAKALTYDQAKQMLSSFGFTEEELNAWLVKPEEL